MTALLSILAVAGDPGGAAAVAPVVARLRAFGRPVTALAYRHARAVWSDRGVAFDELAEQTDRDAAHRHLEAARPGLLLLATSVNGLDLEKHFLAAANGREIPSVAVLDFWSNYRPRFADEQGQLAHLPDRIAVMDEQARREMIADGFDATRLVVTGQPAFDELGAVRRHWQGRNRLELRSQLGVAAVERLVLFASQPLAEVYGEDASHSGFLGYTQWSVLRSLVGALDRIGRRSDEPTVLLVRPHPRERPEALQGLQGSRARVLVDGRGDRHEAALAADLVTGMNSILLVEACLLGCPVISLQPGLRLADALPTNRSGATRAVYRDEDVEPAVAELLFDPAARDELAARSAGVGFLSEAAQRVVSVIDELMTRSRGTSEETP